uniref:Uncharacterized protein n=1 Tax=Solanum lycopersicum TaxID=4081 RepID=A0A3Q7EB94_SOLLC
MLGSSTAAKLQRDAVARRRLLDELSGGCPIRRPDEGNGGVRREGGIWWPLSGGRSK